MRRPLPIERFEVLLDEARPPGGLVGWGAIRVAAWAAVAGIPIELEPPRSAPHAAMLRRDWLGAADAFGDVGWTYDRALMLSLLGCGIGVVIGTGLATVAGGFIGFDTDVTLFAVLVAFAVSASIGVFFGWWPANRAAKLSPIEALRS